MIGLISINYRTSPIEVREKFFFQDKEKVKFYILLQEKYSVDGLVILSTCNRTEIYFETSSNESSSKSFHSVIMTLSKLKKFNDGLRPYIKKKDGVHAISKHLFRLASGLESMIVGEYQIVDQIKSAYKVCKTNKMLSPTLERMIQKSLEASKYSSIFVLFLWGLSVIATFVVMFI